MGYCKKGDGCVCGGDLPCVREGCYEWVKAQPDERAAFIDVVFDGPPSYESGRFVEVEDAEGRSFNAGEWIDRGNGLWALRISRATAPQSVKGDDPIAYTCDAGMKLLRDGTSDASVWSKDHAQPGDTKLYLRPIARAAVPQAGATLTKHEREVLEYAVSQLAAKGLIGTAQNIERIIKDRT